MRFIMVHFIFLFISFLQASFLDFPDFKSSMLRRTITPENLFKRERILNNVDHTYVNFFDELYQKNIMKILNNHDLGKVNNKIPLIVHQIWLGSPLPEKFLKWRESWMNLEGWTYMLWTDKEVAKLNLYNQDLYDRSTNYGEKSDILRLELLFKFGGVYADVDYECLKPQIFESFHNSCDFYIGFEPLEHGKIKMFSMFKLCNALIGSIPKHPLVEKLIINMKTNYLIYLDKGVIQRTGPAYITHVVCNYVMTELMQENNLGLINFYLPCTFLYPFTQKDLENTSIDSLKNIKLPEMAGIHYWNGSWIGGENAFLNEKKTNNYEGACCE